ncbi:helix-turn-helix transcriptional regulator [Tanticharoenia sakaeratensis]|uniref:helix-turn-helix transcriptional regulator n=1 Tax=Tanticharoenia sakaeratensis TaxID=444053 RepID=UPI0022310EB5|nr:helix-turn-helix transcriptional regulator [Tanticharoenia sakaeratensis]
MAKFRTARGLSRNTLAEAVAVNRQTIGYLERGDYKPSLELAMKICRVLQQEVEAVFSLDPFDPVPAHVRRMKERQAGGDQ